MEERREIFQRTERLLGSECMERLKRTRVIVFGVGGVGSWCVEGLVRSGVGHITIVDCDKVSVSNINRQLMATTSTVGLSKVEVLRERMLDINPNLDICALEALYSEETSDTFHLGAYDYIIDAIDSLKDKANLILKATETDAVFFSSMGAALKMDSSRIRVAEFWKVNGCPLGASLRRKFKRTKTFPKKKFQCVYSDELLENQSVPLQDESNEFYQKAQVNGTLAHVTAIFGFTLAGLVLQNVYRS